MLANVSNMNDTLEQNNYYIAPPDSAFKDMKKCAIKVWETYDDEFGYATGKINQIKNIENVSDNFMYMFAMFDIHNQRKCWDMLRKSTRKELVLRLEPDYLETYLNVENLQDYY